MKKPLLLLCASMLYASAAQADTYHFDPGHTEVRFLWDHAGVSEQSGEWGAVKGTVDFKADDIAATKVEVTIDAASVDTGVEKLDEHLRSADFFEVEKFPEIRFASTGAVQTGAESVQVTGDLTIRDKTVPITLDVELVHKGEHPLGAFIEYYQGEWLGVRATGTLLRSTYDVGKFAPLTSDRIRLEIVSEMKVGGWE